MESMHCAKWKKLELKALGYPTYDCDSASRGSILKLPHV